MIILYKKIRKRFFEIILRITATPRNEIHKKLINFYCIYFQN